MTNQLFTNAQGQLPQLLQSQPRSSWQAEAQWREQFIQSQFVAWLVSPGVMGIIYLLNTLSQHPLRADIGQRAMTKTHKVIVSVDLMSRLNENPGAPCTQIQPTTGGENVSSMPNRYRHFFLVIIPYAI